MEATEISGPAQVYSTSSDSLAMVLPTTFTTESTRQPRTLGFAQRRQRIGGLAGLADDDHERVFVEDRVAVTELRCNIHFDRDAQQFFKRVLCHDAHVVRRATGHDVDFCEAARVPRRSR